MAIIDEIRIKQTFDPTGEKGGYKCERLDDKPKEFVVDEAEPITLAVSTPTPAVPNTPAPTSTPAAIGSVSSLYTLPEFGKSVQDQLIVGVIDSIITVNRFFQVFPFDHIQGNALAYNRGAASPGSYRQVVSTLHHIAEITPPTQDPNDAASNVMSASKEVGRRFIEYAGETLYQIALGESNQVFDADNSHDICSHIEEAVSRLHSPAEFLMMPAKLMKDFMAWRKANNRPHHVVTLPDGTDVPGYECSGLPRQQRIPYIVPIFRNDYLTGFCHPAHGDNLIAGVFDDGSRGMGVAGLRPDSSLFVRANDQGGNSFNIQIIPGIASFHSEAIAVCRGIK